MSAKIKKNKLEIDYSYDFELLGVRTSLKGYKLAWYLNNSLKINLVKVQDLIIHFKKDQTASYDRYTFKTQLNELNLFRNKPSEPENSSPDLVPEYPHFDFILMTQSQEKLSGNRLHEYLRNIPSVELATLIPLTALKSKDNFIF